MAWSPWWSEFVGEGEKSVGFFFLMGFECFFLLIFFFFFCFQVWRREMEGEGGGCHFFVECFSLVLLLSVARKKNEKGER